MREYINLIQTLSENTLTEASNLSANELKAYEWRFNMFIDYIKQGKPFTTVDGEEVIIEPSEAKRFFNMYHIGRTFSGSLKAKIKGTNQEIPLSRLAKTSDFGGAAVAAGQEASSAGKEALVIKPSQIGICDKNIPAHDFYDVIAKNATLKSSDYGKEVIKLANYIISDELVYLPPEYTEKNKEKVRKAIVDYAGEYLGVLALLYNRTKFPKRNEFLKWLGGSTDDLVLNFPSKSNTKLADSFATITNPGTQHSLNISSKGTGGGAAPAISGLKVSDELKRNPAFKDVVKFIEICQTKGTIEQAFDAMDLLFQSNPKSIDKRFHKFLPFSSKSPKLQALAANSVSMHKAKQGDSSLPSKYSPLFSDVASSDASDGGKLIYAIKKEVAHAINNKNGLPEFQGAVLQILEMNFVQQYTDYYSNGEIKFYTQWPAKLDGNISVENKSSAKSPTDGGFSFKLGRVDDDVSSEPGVPRVDDLGPDVSDVAKDIVEPKRKSKPQSKPGLGREKRSK